ncbi:MAG: LamG domain-containing protein, partial [Hyphomicrobiaceae bacterium]
VVFMTRSEDDRVALGSLLGSGSPVLLQVNGHPDRLVSLGDRSSTRLADQGWVEEHDDALVWTVVGEDDRVVGVGSWPYADAVPVTGLALFLPLGASAGLTDLSGNSRNGTAVGGLTAGGVATGPLVWEDNGATDFDGTNDYISTDYATRRNMIPNPRFANDTALWSVAAFYHLNAGATITRTTPALEQTGPYIAAVVTTAAAAAQGASIPFTGQTFKAGVQYTFRARVYGGGSMALQLFFGQATADHNTTLFTNNWSGWQDVSVSWTPAADTTAAHAGIRTSLGSGPQAGTFYFTGCIAERGSSPGPYFDGSGKLNGSSYGTWIANTEGECGWLGTAHASASDIGPFANGTARTFMGWAWRDTSSSADTLIYGRSPSGPSHTNIALGSGSDNVAFSPDNSTFTTWLGAWPGNGVWVHWAVTFDEATNALKLYIDGALVSAETNTAQYSGTGVLAVSDGSFFDGKMAEVCVYERALTATEIQAAVAAETPARAVAVLNDPSDPDFCGYLDGEEAISGIDSPEIRDSYSDLIEQDGGVGATNFYSRRPIVMNGIVLPISPADRNAKIGKLMAATDARSGDGTLTWTPSGGEPVFAKFRRQLPFRATGGFNKKFQIGLACNDPRIYTQRAMTMYTETNGNSGSRDYRRFTWSSGTGTTLATRNVYLPPGTWDIYLPVKRSTAAGTLTLAASSSTGADTPGTLTTDWTEVVQTRVTSNAESVATTITLTLDSTLTTGQWVEVGDLRVESPDGLYPSDSATFATNWTAGSGYTASFQTASPPPAYIQNPGNALSRPRVRLLGPFASASATIAGTAPAQFAWMIPGSAYSGTDYAVIDFGYRTVVKNGTTNDYGAISTASTWGGFRPDMADYPYLSAVSGATTATRMETTWRGVWL